MKKFKTLKLIIFLSVAVAVVFYACKKDSEGDANSEALYISAGADIDVTTFANFLFYEVHEQMIDVGDLKSATGTGCKSVISLGADTIADFQKYYIGYVDECIQYNRQVKGNIMFAIKASNYWVGTGLRNVIEMNNVMVNGMYASGVMFIGYEGKNGLGQPVFTQKIDSCFLHYNDSVSVKFSCNRTITWVAGYDKAYRIDDRFEISGTAMGVDLNHKAFVDTIAVPLVFSNPGVCKWIKAGKMNMYNSETEGSVSFSTCDSLASFDTHSMNKKIPQPF